MGAHPLPDGVTESLVQTDRVATHTLFSGDAGGTPVVFVHGNISTNRFFADTLAALPEAFYGIAPTLRGFGDTEAKPIDGTRGVRDFSDDLAALLTALDLGRPAHLVGWSVGGAVVMQYGMDHGDRVASLTLIDPMSPFGFGGTGDAEGSPLYDDWAGTGAGTANPDFVQSIADGERGTEHPNTVRNVMRGFFFKPTFEADPVLEDLWVEEILKTRTGDDFYPGDVATSENWPGVKPGTRGMNNAISGRYTNLRGFAESDLTAPVLWIRGAEDAIVSDTSFFDFGFLGSQGFVPGWPGEETYPPQPMVQQIRWVLDAYAAHGGSYREVVIDDAAHSPHIEQPEAFNQALHSFLESA